MSARKLPDAARGFTLLEALMATAVFLIGVVGFMGAMAQARGSTAWARRDVEASAIASDLAGQMDLWAYGDLRLSNAASAPCTTDPADVAGALLKDPHAFDACAHTEADLGTYLGRGSPTFPVGSAVTDRFTRLWVVREEDANGNPVASNGVRKRIWVLVTYQDGGIQRRIVSYQTKVQRGALQ